MISLKRGQTRIVIIIENWLVIKMPIIHLFSGLLTLVRRIRSGHFVSHEIKEFNYLMFGSVKERLFGGLITNWKEFIFYRKHQLPILMPTYFSFFGLVNIQKYGSPLKIEGVDLWCQLHTLTDGQVFDDCHTFTNPDNFCTESGRLKIIDYGEKIHNFLINHGEKIYNEFDFSYSREGDSKIKRS